MVYSAHRGGFGVRVGRNCAVLIGERDLKRMELPFRYSRGVTRSREAIFSLHEASEKKILEAVQFWYLHFKRGIETLEKVKKVTLKIICSNSPLGRDFRYLMYSAFQEKRRYDYIV